MVAFVAAAFLLTLQVAVAAYEARKVLDLVGGVRSVLITQIAAN